MHFTEEVFASGIILDVLPEGFDEWTREERIKWHQARITRESRVHRAFHAQGWKTDFPTEELKQKLIYIKQSKQQVVNQLNLLQNKEFQQIWKEFEEIWKKYIRVEATRAGLLERKFRRKTALPDKDQEHLAALRSQSHSLRNELEELQDDMMFMAEEYGVSPINWCLLKIREDKL